MADTASSPAAPLLLQWHPAHRDSSVLLFTNGDTLRTGLHRIKGLGHVTVGDHPYVLLAGRYCTDCNAPSSLYILPTHAGKAATADGANTWHLPGKLHDGRTGEVYYEADVYSGEVLPDTVGVIWFERQLLPDGKIKENTTVLRLNGPEPDTLVLFGTRRKSITQGLAFRGACRQLPPMDQTMAP